jgi:hypothetical protein
VLHQPIQRNSAAALEELHNLAPLVAHFFPNRAHRYKHIHGPHTVFPGSIPVNHLSFVAPTAEERAKLSQTLPVREEGVHALNYALLNAKQFIFVQ